MGRTFSGLALAALLTLTATPSPAQRKPDAKAEKAKPAPSQAKARPSAESAKSKTDAAPPKAKTAAAKPKTAAAKPTPKPADGDALKAEVDEIVKLDAATRVERLSAFVKANPDTPQTLRARELLTSARAALGDEKLRAGDRAAGAELKRATGKPEEAAALYREQLAANAQDASARAGVVLSLFDAGKREEAERELQSALTGEARDLPLLVGASYWHAAHGDGARALELAEKALTYESRFGWAWSRVAQGRALLALKRPLET